MTSHGCDADRFDYLFDLAEGTASIGDSALSPDEMAEVALIREILEAIDESWEATDAQQDRVQALFLQQLAEKYPEHPWVKNSVVHTLGDLIRGSEEAAPELPAGLRTQLAEDPTPVESLLDPAQRVRAVGQALRRAGLPQGMVASFMIWLNRAIADLLPHPAPGAPGLLFARKQRRQSGRR